MGCPLDQGGLRRGKCLLSTRGFNYLRCRNCGKKKKKKSRRQRYIGDGIFGGEEERYRLLLVLSAFGLLLVLGDRVDIKSDILPDEKDGSNVQGPFYADKGSLWIEEDYGS